VKPSGPAVLLALKGSLADADDEADAADAADEADNADAVTADAAAAAAPGRRRLRGGLNSRLPYVKSRACA
jgi:hypothetical protein